MEYSGGKLMSGMYPPAPNPIPPDWELMSEQGHDTRHCYWCMAENNDRQHLPVEYARIYADGSERHFVVIEVPCPKCGRFSGGSQDGVPLENPNGWV